MAQRLTLPVEHCDTMADVRRHIDALDDRIVSLMAERSGYVAQAARIKPSVDKVYDADRIDFIVDRVRAQAQSLGAPPEVLEATYRAMISAFIDFETREFLERRAGKSADTQTEGTSKKA